MGKWEMVRLADVFDLQMGKTPRRDNPKYWDNGSNKWISIADIGRVDKYISDTKEGITQIAVNETGIRIVPQDTVIMSFKLSLGKTAITLESMYTNEAIMAFLDKEKYQVDIDYIYHLFCCFNWGESTNKAVMGATLNKATLSNIKIPIPPLDEQKHIAKNLDLASEIVKGCKKQLAELDKLVQSVFYDMFGDPVTNEKGWEIQSLQSVCDVRDGTHDSPTYVGDGYPLVTSKNVSQGYIDLSTANLISHEDLLKINQRSKVDTGDIIMPMIGTIGNPVIVNVNQEFAVKNVAIIKFAGSIMCNIFIKTLLSTSFFENAIQKANRGGTQKFIALGDIRKLPIPIPPSDVQTRFTSLVTEIEVQKSQVQQALTEAKNLFNGLMQEYFE